MKKTIHILFPLIVYFVSHDMLQFLLYMLVNVLAGSGPEMVSFLQKYSPYVSSGVQILAMTLAAAATWWAERYCRLHGFFAAEKESLQGKMTPGCLTAYIVKATIQFTLLAFSLNCIFLQTGINRLSGTFQGASASQAQTPVIMAILLFGVVSPLVEEYVFRYLLFGHMKCYFSSSLSIGISALFFGIYHANLVQGLYGFFMGLYLAYSYEYVLKKGLSEKKGMLVPLVCHGVANLLVFFGGQFNLFISIPLWAAGVFLLLGVAMEIPAKLAKTEEKMSNN